MTAVEMRTTVNFQHCDPHERGGAERGPACPERLWSGMQRRLCVVRIGLSGGVNPVFRLRVCVKELHARALESGFEVGKIQNCCVFFKKIAKNYVQVLVFCTNCFFFVLIFVS
jgi:hypothetical protein